MNELAISVAVGVASVTCIALSWRTPSVKRLLLPLAILMNVGMGQLWSAEADSARLVSWSVSGALIVAGMLSSNREHWRSTPLILWGLVAVLVAASYFLTDIPRGLYLGLLVTLGVTTGVALLSSLIFLARFVRNDTTERA